MDKGNICGVPTRSMGTEKADGEFWRHECNRCGNVWYSRNKSPRSCANKKCKSPYWNKARVRPYP